MSFAPSFFLVGYSFFFFYRWYVRYLKRRFSWFVLTKCVFFCQFLLLSFVQLMGGTAPGSVLFHLDLFCFGGCSLTLAKFMGSLQRWWGGPAQHARVDAHAHVWSPGVRQHLKLFHIFPISQVPVIELSWITPQKKTNMFRENSSLDVDSLLKWSFFWGGFPLLHFHGGLSLWRPDLQGDRERNRDDGRTRGRNRHDDRGNRHDDRNRRGRGRDGRRRGPQRNAASLTFKDEERTS